MEKYKISEDVLKKTTKCANGFKCLENGSSTICKWESYLSPDVLFIKPKDGFNCAYLMSFGYSFICNCPTRIELYKRYQV